MTPEEGINKEYVEDDDVLPAYSRATSTWHTPTRDEVFDSQVRQSFSPAYTPDDYTWWSATGCTAGNGEKFDPCSRSSIYIAEVGIMFL